MGGSDEGVDNDCARIGIGNFHCDYRLPKEEAESELIDVYCHPVKEETEPELPIVRDGGSDEGAGNDFAPNITATDSDGGASGDCARIGIDNYYCDYRLPKEEPESELIDIYCHPVKEEPEPELPATGADTVIDSSRDVGYDRSYCGISLSTREFKVEHEPRCKAQMQQREFDSKITVYHCGYCKCPFISEEYREQHQLKWCRKRPDVARRCSNGTYFKCDKCEYVTKWKYHLESHLLNHNKNNTEWFTCTQCSYKTVHKRYMTQHMKIHSNTFSCRCIICGKSFRTKRCLDEHLLKQHSDKLDDVSELITFKIYTCNICSRFRTSQKNAFNRHVAITHHKGVGCQKYECPCCSYSTFSKGHLSEHFKRHTGQKDHRCTACEKQFTQKRDLDLHILCNHDDDVDLVKTITTKIHCCTLCSFKTVNVTGVKRHIQSKHI